MSKTIIGRPLQNGWTPVFLGWPVGAAFGTLEEDNHGFGGPFARTDVVVLGYRAGTLSNIRRMGPGFSDVAVRAAILASSEIWLSDDEPDEKRRESDHTFIEALKNKSADPRFSLSGFVVADRDTSWVGSVPLGLLNHLSEEDGRPRYVIVPPTFEGLLGLLRACGFPDPELETVAHDVCSHYLDANWDILYIWLYAATYVRLRDRNTNFEGLAMVFEDVLAYVRNRYAEATLQMYGSPKKRNASSFSVGISGHGREAYARLTEGARAYAEIYRRTQVRLNLAFGAAQARNDDPRVLVVKADPTEHDFLALVCNALHAPDTPVQRVVILYPADREGDKRIQIHSRADLPQSEIALELGHWGPPICQEHHVLDLPAGVLFADHAPWGDHQRHIPEARFRALFEGLPPA